MSFEKRFGGIKIVKKGIEKISEAAGLSVEDAKIMQEEGMTPEEFKDWQRKKDLEAISNSVDQKRKEKGDNFERNNKGIRKL